MSFKDDLKAIIIKSGWSMTAVVQEINNRNHTDFTVQNFSAKLTRGTLKYLEVVEVLDIIGYEVQWIKKT